MRHILVTGGAGFIGLAVCRALAERGDRVTAIDVAIGPGLAALAATTPSVRAVPGELLEWPRVAEILAADCPHAVIHCAALVGVLNSVHAPMATMRVNVEGTLTLLEAMRLYGIRRMIHISTEETYGAFNAPRITEDHPQNPVMAYGVSKLAVEHLARSYRVMYDIETIHMRTSWVYGPGLPRLRVPRTFIDAALDGRAYHLASGADFTVGHTYIDDVVKGLLLALDHPDHLFDAYNLASGTAPRLGDIVATVRELIPGARITIGPGPYDHGTVGGRPVPSVQKGALDITRAGSVLGYRPSFDIRSGLAAYIAHERALRQA